MLRITKSLAAVSIAAVVVGVEPGAAQAPEAITIDSKLAVKVRPYSPTPTVRAFASVILLAGGNGVLDLTDAGDIRDLQGNFLIRSARLFLNAGLNVAMLDAAPDLPAPTGLTNQRLTQAHANHLGKVMIGVRQRWPNTAVWLVGTSNGTLSAVNAAARLTGHNLPSGIVLTSAVTAPDPAGESHFVTEPGSGLGSITVPTLVVWHTEDVCPFSHKNAAATVFAGLVGVPAGKKAEYKPSNGTPNVAMSLCSAFGYHGYNGNEAEVVIKIVQFIKNNYP